LRFSKSHAAFRTVVAESKPDTRPGGQRHHHSGDRGTGLVDKALRVAGFLYLFPIMFAAAFLPRWFVALLGVVCAVLAEVFSSLDPSFVRLTFEALALAGCGLFVGELVRNRRLSLESQASWRRWWRQVQRQL